MKRSRKETLRAKIEQEMLEGIKGRAEAEAAFADDFVNKATQENPWQKEFIKDPSLYKALFGERRGGKSSCVAISAIETALKDPFAKILYVGLKQDSVRRVMFDEVLPKFKREFGIPAKFIGGDEMVFDNGSKIYLIGLDANKTQKEKVRGLKCNLVILDEMQSYKQDAKLIIQEILGPTVADTRSSILICGTAGNTIGNSYWYQITRHNTKDNPISYSVLHPEWKVYRCSWEKNRAFDDKGGRICDNVRMYIEEQERLHPGWKSSDSFRKEYCAEWIVETSSMIYKYTEANNLLSPLCCDIGSGERIPMPNATFLAPGNGIHYIFGLDLGMGDPTAMIVLGYNSKLSNRLYVIEAFQKEGMLINEVVAKIKALNNYYNFSHMVGDSSNLQVFDTLRETYGFPLQKAERQGKLSHQLLLNTDLQTRSIIFMPGCEELTHQLQNLTWDPEALKKGRWIEDPLQKNDLADAFLYAYHFSRHMWYIEPVIQDPFLTHAEFNKQFADILIRENRKKKNDIYGSINFAAPNIKGRWRN